ncbi:phage head-tail adaptor, putative, SPP1 family [Halopseudomonas litoralis]|uniref:Phage head-tail adaptor, putative, SPP1 family n=1 Tax=Halopseudomonas litoralis TaxID=797277 RepID=A0A1H1NX53_9GAMM|nr:phage head closure protein [Halopseudomonas litoralis]SDS03375.1 phage head-tail adaptor, putative, SPP1 family [Halopseudomonas litoralis]
MRNGPLRHRITLQQRVQVQDPVTGEVVPGWIDWARPMARIEPLSARDFIAAKAAQSEVTGRIVIRYREGVLPTMRILYRGKVYSIHGVLPDTKSGREYLTLPVSEGVRDG